MVNWVFSGLLAQETKQLDKNKEIDWYTSTADSFVSIFI